MTFSSERVRARKCEAKEGKTENKKKSNLEEQSQQKICMHTMRREREEEVHNFFLNMLRLVWICSWEMLNCLVVLSQEIIRRQFKMMMRLCDGRPADVLTVCVRAKCMQLGWDWGILAEMFHFWTILSGGKYVNQEIRWQINFLEKLR